MTACERPNSPRTTRASDLLLQQVRGLRARSATLGDDTDGCDTRGTGENRRREAAVSSPGSRQSRGGGLCRGVSRGDTPVGFRCGRGAGGEDGSSDAAVRTGELRPPCHLRRPPLCSSSPPGSRVLQCWSCWTRSQIHRPVVRCGTGSRRSWPLLWPRSWPAPARSLRSGTGRRRGLGGWMAVYRRHGHQPHPRHRRPPAAVGHRHRARRTSSLGRHADRTIDRCW